MKEPPNRDRNQRAIESPWAVTVQQLRILQAMQGNGLARLQESTLTSALDAVKALELSFRQERLLAGIDAHVGTEPRDET